MIPGKHTTAAAPFGANHDSECMINAISALDFGARTPAGAKRGSLINVASSLPFHFMEYG